MDGTTNTLLSGVQEIITNLGTVASFIWGLFADLLETILSNPLLAFPVLFAVLAGGSIMVIQILRKFGVSGKR